MVLQSHSSNSSRSGFTLVELLVVIAIIGLLVALLVPAVNVARETARKAQCTNNLRNLGQSVVLHQTSKQSMPGRINFVTSNVGAMIPVSWMTKLLPYMDKSNVWEAVLTQSITLDNWSSIVIPAIANPTTAPVGPSGQPPWYTLDLELATCPTDPATSQIGARLSYVYNSGIWDRAIGDTGAVSRAIEDPSHPWYQDSRANGVGMLLQGNASSNKVDIGYISKGDGATSTMMLSENINALSWPMLEEAATCMVWTTQEVSLLESEPLTVDRQYGINVGHELYLDEQLLRIAQSGPNQLISIARPSSNHSGGVNTVFCDGHVEFLSAEMHPWVYARRLSVSKSQAVYPGFTKGQVPAQVSPIDSNNIAVPTDF